MEVSGRKSDDNDKSSSSYMPTCDPCESTGETKNAEHYCTECEEYLCDSCSNAHRKLRFSRNHQLLGQDEMPKQKLCEKTEIHCTKHDGKPFDYYCQSHEKVCCTVCVTLEHRECDVEYINHLMDRFETSGEYGALREEISNLDAQVRESISEVESNVFVVNKSHDTIIDEIRQFRQEINSKLDLLEKEVLARARKIKAEDIQIMSSIKSELSQIKQELQDTTEKLDSYASLKQNKQLVISCKLNQLKMADVELKIGQICKRNKVREMQFQRNENIMEAINSFGDMGSIEEKKEDRRRTTQKDKLQQNPVHKPFDLVPNGAMRVRHVQDGSVCHITGMKMIDFTRLALVDYNNSSIKIVNLQQPQSQIIAYLKLDLLPWGITTTDKNLLIVTAPDHKALIFLDIGRKLTVSKTLKVHEKCYGVGYIDNMLIVSFIAVSMVHIERSIKFLNIEGQVIKHLCAFTQTLYPVFPRSIVSSIDKQHIYITEENTVIKIDMNGTVIDDIGSDVLKRPQDITVDKYGTAYIAGQYSHNICVLTAGSREIKPVLEVENPIAIEVCRESDQIVISQNGKDKIFVYKLT